MIEISSECAEGPPSRPGPRFQRGKRMEKRSGVIDPTMSAMLQLPHLQPPPLPPQHVDQAAYPQLKALVAVSSARIQGGAQLHAELGTPQQNMP
mmetsp:Transcript_3756/g.11002  ORF Transcript_3756/g.11002 Transcript_3756/m.11002 type:complete len:94 (-) Transcript_3756:335-616(-)